MTQMRLRLPERREGLTIAVSDGRELFDVSLSFFPAGAGSCAHQVAELFFVSRGTVGQDFDAIMMELGIAISRALQRRPAPCSFTVPPILLPPSELRIGDSYSPPIGIAFMRGGGALAGDLVGIAIRAPQHPGYDARLAAIAADLTQQLAALPPAGAVRLARNGALRITPKTYPASREGVSPL